MNNKIEIKIVRKDSKMVRKVKRGQRGERGRISEGAKKKKRNRISEKIVCACVCVLI